jgi:hypothetical protein
MEAIISFLTLLQSLSPLAIIALLGVVIFKLVWKNPIQPIETSLHELKSNHLHELPGMADNLNKIVEVLQRMEVKQGEEFSFIRAKLTNGQK